MCLRRAQGVASLSCLINGILGRSSKRSGSQ